MTFEVGMTVCHWRAGARVRLLRVTSVGDRMETDDGSRWTRDGRGVTGLVLPATEADLAVIEQERAARRLSALLTWLSTNATRLPMKTIASVERHILVAARDAISVRYAGYAEETRRRLTEEQVQSLLNLAASAEDGA